MELFELMQYLDFNEIEIQVQQGKLNIVGSEDLLTDELISNVKQYKDRNFSS